VAHNGVGRRRFEAITLHIMLIGFGFVIGLTAVVTIARALRARSTLNDNRMMREHLRRIASEGSPDF